MKTPAQITEMFIALLALNDIRTAPHLSDDEQERLKGMLVAFGWIVGTELPAGYEEWFKRMLTLSDLQCERPKKRKKAKSHQISKAE